MKAKSFLRSKTVLVNAALAAASASPLAQQWITDHVAVYTFLIAAANIGLRFISNEAVSFKVFYREF